MNLIVSILLIISFLIINYYFFYFITIKERNIRIKALKDSLSYFSITKMQKIIDEYEGISNKIDENLSIIDESNSLIKYQYKVIFKYIDNLSEINNSKKFLKSYFNFKHLYKQTYEIIIKYQNEYIEKRFLLLNKNIENELEKKIIINIKQELRNVKSQIENSPLEEINNSKKLDKKIIKIQAEILRLEELSKNKLIPLSEEFKNTSIEIVVLIDQLEKNSNFIKNSLNHLDQELHGSLEEIVSLYNENKNSLKELNEPIKLYVFEIKKLKKSIKSDVIELKEASSDKSINRINDLIKKLNLLIKSNIDYVFFNEKYIKLIDNLFIDFNKNIELIINEVKRHGVNNENERLAIIRHAASLFDSEIIKFQNETSLKYNRLKPSEKANLILSVVNEYKEYINTVIKQVKDISDVNNEINIINEKIFNLNANILKIEYNLNDISGNNKELLEIEKLKLQEKVKKIREFYKNNINKVEDQTYKIIEKLNEKILNLLKLVESISFKIFFIEKSVMMLNKYRGNDDNFDELLESIEKSFNNQKYNDCLRKIKETIEIYGIKE